LPGRASAYGAVTQEPGFGNCDAGSPDRPAAAEGATLQNSYFSYYAFFTTNTGH